MASQRESAEAFAREFLAGGWPTRGAARVSKGFLVYHLTTDGRDIALAHREGDRLVVMHKDERWRLPSPPANLVNTLVRLAKASGVAITEERGLTERWQGADALRSAADSSASRLTR